MTWTIQRLLDYGKEKLNILEYENKYLDARLLLEYVLGCNRVYLLLNKEKIVEEKLVKTYMDLLELRLKGKPLQYLIGTQNFMGMDIYVNEYTLIPRRETEELVELALEIIEKENIELIIDIGTGSGCIPIALCTYNPDIKVIGIDCSKQALNVAKKNSIHYNVYNRIKWIKSDLFKNIKGKYKEKIDMIISNPPYIKTSDIDNLMVEVKSYEPILALDGGKDGLDYYRRISSEGRKFLKKDGIIIYEVGYDQCKDVMLILEKNGYRDIKSKKDLSGIDRIVYAKK